MKFAHKQVSNGKEACDQNVSTESSKEPSTEETSSGTSGTQVELRTQIKRRRGDFLEDAPDPEQSLKKIAGELCEMKFSNVGNLDQHMKYIHGGRFFLVLVT